MNTFKKIMASVLAITSVTSIAGVMANAEETNAVSVSYETLTSSVTADDGTVIPAGYIAVNINLANNTGFNVSTLKFDLCNSNVLVNNQGKAAISKGNILQNTLIASSQNNNIMVFAGASANVCTTDGTLLTFYVSDSTEIDIVNYSFSTASAKNTLDNDNNDGIATCGELRYYRIGNLNGDLNQDGSIKESDDESDTISIDDASIALSVIAKYGTFVSGREKKAVAVSSANRNLYEYGLSGAIKAEAADGNKDNYIDEDDATQILQFYSDNGAGLEYDVEGWYIGEYTLFIV